jgi:hypothetical protein
MFAFMEVPLLAICAAIEGTLALPVFPLRAKLVTRVTAQVGSTGVERGSAA